MNWRNKIFNKDAESFLKEIPGHSIHLTVTSPPYDNLRDYHSLFDLDTIIRELYRVTVEGGIVVWVVGDQTKNFSETGTSFKQALAFKELGWCLYDTMIWVKKNYMPSGNPRYAYAFEYMFVFSKGKPRVFNPLKVPCITAGKPHAYTSRPHKTKFHDRNEVEDRIAKAYKTRPNIWEYGVGLGGSTMDKIAFDHPAIFPEALVSDHIKTWTHPGDVVADIFSGSGTTGKVAMLLERIYTGSEIDKNYWILGNSRIKSHRNLFTH